MTDLTNIPPTAEYTVDECAALLGVSRQTVYRYCLSGLRFGVRRRNGRRFFKGADIKAFGRAAI